MGIYLDNAATTKINTGVFQRMIPYLTEYYGNPSSPYSIGEKSKEAIELAREQCARLINADVDEIFFTSCGSEANNWVIKSFDKVLVSAIEHHSILNAKDDLDICPVDNCGYIEENYYTEHSKLADLCSIMMVNNEIGTINDVKKLTKIAHENGCLFHTDAVQAIGHEFINVKDLEVDFLSMSGHKIGAPKGIGFLYASKNAQKYLKPLISGGLQEHNMRAGTENLANIVGLGWACKYCKEEFSVNKLIRRSLSKTLYNLLIEKIDDVYLIGADLEDRVDSNINVRIKGINAAQLIAYCDEQDIWFSSGSACDTESQMPSHVLLAIGLYEKHTDECIRLTVSKNNSHTDIIKTVDTIAEFVKMTRGY